MRSLAAPARPLSSANDARASSQDEIEDLLDECRDELDASEESEAEDEHAPVVDRKTGEVLKHVEDDELA